MSFSPSFDDTVDFENAERGFIARLDPCIIKAADGRVVWNNEEYSFMQDPCPSTANPKLWRQGQLLSKQGLYEVAPGIYQIRGFDISNITFVEGLEGVMVIDPLISTECAAAALDLYRRHRGDRRVTGLVYSHSHIDHFGGAAGVLPSDSSSIPIIAPEGFMEEVLSENIFAGTAMRRRAGHMYGSFLPKCPTGQIGVGLAMGVSRGTNSLVPPNKIIRKTGDELTIDGVRIVFQMVPETEAPAEMNFYFPASRALCIAECATHALHNIITLRGALVRDAKAWSQYMDESIVLYGKVSDVLFASHGWPTWGRRELQQLLAEQRDLYGYLHDQTLRMINLGMTGLEIAERIKLPPALQKTWHTQGFYGSVSHNVKGIYQRYMTWFDGDPAHLWQYPAQEEGERYVRCLGGVDATVTKAEEFVREGDLRFAATLLGHAVAGFPRHERAKQALTLVFEKLGYGAENATWRNFYLTAAQDLRIGKKMGRQMAGMSPFGPTLSIGQWFGGLSILIDGEAASEESFAIDIDVTDVGESWRLIVSNGAFIPRRRSDREEVDAADISLKLSRQSLLALLQGQAMPEAVHPNGNVAVLEKLLELTSIRSPGSTKQSQL